MAINLTLQGMAKHGENLNQVLRAIVTHQSHYLLSTGTALTNNSGGTEGRVGPIPRLSDAARSGTQAAPKLATASAIDLVEAGLMEIASDVKKAHVSLDLPVITVSYTGTANGTIAALSTSVTGAATGTPSEKVNTALARVQTDSYALASMINRLCRMCGVDEVPNDIVGEDEAWYDAYTFANISTVFDNDTTNSASATALGLSLVACRTNVKTLAEKMIDLRTTPNAAVTMF